MISQIEDNAAALGSNGCLYVWLDSDQWWWTVVWILSYEDNAIIEQYSKFHVLCFVLGMRRVVCNDAVDVTL